MNDIIFIYLYDRKRNKYIGIDESSGGYPWYPNEIYLAKQFYSIAKAREYALYFSTEDWVIHEVICNELNIKEINIKNDTITVNVPLRKLVVIDAACDKLGLDPYGVAEGVDGDDLIQISVEDAKEWRLI